MISQCLWAAVDGGGLALLVAPEVLDLADAQLFDGDAVRRLVLPLGTITGKVRASVASVTAATRSPSHASPGSDKIPLQIRGDRI